MVSKIRQWYSQFSAHERLLVWILTTTLTAGLFLMLGSLQTHVSTTVPQSGGNYTEGVVGFARYVNPVLANTAPDNDMTDLIYSGLTKRSSNGDIEPDLAVGFSANSDQTAYTFNLNPDATFHDGHPVRAEDVVFTIESIKDPAINSPKQAQWQEVEVTATDSTTVTFTTDEPFADLPTNATVGILPKHLWDEESSRSFAFSRLNTEPIGSGPYKIQQVTENNSGTPSVYELKAFKGYTQNKPYISDLTLRFYPDNQSLRSAYENGLIDGMSGVDPAYASRLKAEGARVESHQFNRIFSVFFNQNNNKVLADENVRSALAAAIPKQEIIESALAGFGSSVSGPLPPNLVSTKSNSTSTTTSDSDSESTSTSSPQGILADAGWVQNEGTLTKDQQQLSITLTTADIPLLRKTSNIIESSWEKLGVAVSTQTLQPNELSREVIRPRNYDALLFGQSFTSIRDLYSFWHSSRQEDPGLNLAQYANTNVDENLQALRRATSSDEITRLQNDIISTIQSEQPAAFLFSPSFLYVLPKKLQNVELPPVTNPADRFSQISNWYTETDRLWNVFVGNQNQQR
jgi:peptide/nickel transport system substrate-binding protein